MLGIPLFPQTGQSLYMGRVARDYCFNFLTFISGMDMSGGLASLGLSGSGINSNHQIWGCLGVSIGWLNVCLQLRP